MTIAYNGFCLLHHTKPGLYARDIISSGTMFSCVLYSLYPSFLSLFFIYSRNFTHIKVMAADLRKSYSEDNLANAPWRFPLSFIPFLVLYIFLSKVRISPKVTIACNGFCLLHHTKPGLYARDIISSGTMFSCVLYYIVNFEIIALDK